MSVFRNDILKRRDLDDRRRFFCLDQGRKKKKNGDFRSFRALYASVAPVVI